VRPTDLRSKSRLPLAFSVPKREDQDNEDSFQRSAKGVYALSDGASVSFDSASWARILVRRYTRNPEFTREWLSAGDRRVSQLYDRDSLPWMQQASFDKGSFASLLGIRIADGGRAIQVPVGRRQSGGALRRRSHHGDFSSLQRGGVHRVAAADLYQPDAECVPG